MQTTIAPRPPTSDKKYPGHLDKRPSGFKPGSLHPRWKHGRVLTAKGYVRITAGSDRNRYEHRVILERLLGRPLRLNEEVHHIDFKRSHNCPDNLLLLDEVFHHMSP